MKGKTKKSIVVLIILLAIGFAAVTTTLTINGIIRLGANQKDFEDNLVFTKASLIYSDANNATTVAEREPVSGTVTATTPSEINISPDGKEITFQTKKLTNIGETVTLKYDLVNRSQYGADISGLACKIYTTKNGVEEEVTDEVAANTEYIAVMSKPTAALVPSKYKTDNTLKDQTMEIRLRKSYVGTFATETEAAVNETSYRFECTLNAKGISETDGTVNDSKSSSTTTTTTTTVTAGESNPDETA